MTNKELKEKIAHLEAELAEVKEKAVALPKRVNGVFKPEDRGRYWSIMSVGDVAEGLWNDHPFNHDHYAIGNCFPTEQAAVDTVRVLKLIQKARESQDGYVPDWGDWEKGNYFLYFNKKEKELRITEYFLTDQAPIFGYWEDESVCEQFVQDNHDELRWFFTEYRR